MVVSFVVNICMLISLAGLIGYITRNQPVIASSQTRYKVMYGLMYGLAGIVMTCIHSIVFPMQLPDLSTVTVILPSLYGGALPLMLSAVLQALYRIVGSHYLTGGADAASLLAMAVCCAMIIRRWKHPGIRWAMCTALLLIVGSMLADNSASFVLLSSLPSAMVGLCLISLISFVALGGFRRVVSMNQMLKLFADTDPLTGLANYRKLRSELEKHCGQPAYGRMCLILADCEEITMLNAKFGYQSINQQFINTGNELKRSFPEAIVISRYEGDKFCIVTRAYDPDQLKRHLQTVMEERLPSLTQLTYKYVDVIYPDEADNAEEWIGKAESKLARIKKDYWMLREEKALWTEKMKVLGEMAASMAHEIRNPLTTVKGFLQIAHQTKEYDRWYPLIMQEIDRMAGLTVEFLGFSKPGQHQAADENLGECVKRAYQLIEPEALKLGHLSELQVQEAMISVRIDRDKMMQVLLNMMKNGLEAMEQSGHLTVRVYTELLDASVGSGTKRWAVVQIADCGPGIEAQLLPKIFDPFYSTKEKGTGLGLAICKRIIQSHGGFITVTSEQGIGTSFFIKLPCIDQPSPTTIDRANG